MEHFNGPISEFRCRNSCFLPSDNFLPENTVPSNYTRPVGNNVTRPMQYARHWNCGQSPRLARDTETTQDYEDLNAINGLVQQMIYRQNDPRVDQQPQNVDEINQRTTVDKLMRELAELKNEFKNREIRTTEDIRLLTEQNKRTEEKLQRAVEDGRDNARKNKEEWMQNTFFQKTISDDLKYHDLRTERELKELKNDVVRLGEMLRSLEDSRRSHEAAMSQVTTSCNCSVRDLNGLKNDFDRFKNEWTHHVENSRTPNNDARNENANIIRKYDKVKTRLAAIERELQKCRATSSAARDSDHSLLTMMQMSAMRPMTTTVVCCGGGGGGTRVLAEDPSPRAPEVTTTSAVRSAPEPPRFAPVSQLPAASEPPFSAIPSPPPPPPPAPLAPKAAPPKIGAEGKIAFERMPMTVELLKSVTLAKEGEPVKKIKLPSGIVINRKTTTAAAEQPGANVASAPSAAAAAEPKADAPAASPLITAELLRAVTLAKDGEPVKKIKMPKGMVIKKTTTASASSSAIVEPEAEAPAASPLITAENKGMVIKETTGVEPIVSTSSSAIVDPEPTPPTPPSTPSAAGTPGPFHQRLARFNMFNQPRPCCNVANDLLNLRPLAIALFLFIIVFYHLRWVFLLF